MIAVGAVLFVAAGMTSGLWIQLSLLAVTFGIFMATVTLRNADAPKPQGGGRVISLNRLSSYGIESVQDLDEVA